MQRECKWDGGFAAFPLVWGGLPVQEEGEPGSMQTRQRYTLRKLRFSATHAKKDDSRLSSSPWCREIYGCAKVNPMETTYKRHAEDNATRLSHSRVCGAKSRSMSRRMDAFFQRRYLILYHNTLRSLPLEPRSSRFYPIYHPIYNSNINATMFNNIVDDALSQTGVSAPRPLNDSVNAPHAPARSPLPRGSENRVPPSRSPSKRGWDDHTEEARILADWGIEDPDEDEQLDLYNSISLESDDVEEEDARGAWLDHGYGDLEDFGESAEEATASHDDGEYSPFDPSEVYAGPTAGELDTAHAMTDADDDGDDMGYSEEDIARDDSSEDDSESVQEESDASEQDMDSSECDIESEVDIDSVANVDNSSEVGDDDGSEVNDYAAADRHWTEAGVSPGDESTEEVIPIPAPATSPALRRSSRLRTVKRGREYEREDTPELPPAKRRKPTHAPRVRGSRSQSNATPAKGSVKTSGKGKQRQARSESPVAGPSTLPAKTGGTRGPRIQNTFLLDHCMVSKLKTVECGFAGCKHVLVPTQARAARKHLRAHHTRAQLGATQVQCLWHGCPVTVSSGELTRHYDAKHLELWYGCPGKCKDAEGKPREYQRIDQLSRHELDNPCDYLKANPIPRGKMSTKSQKR
ncbi:uncharacterized protein TRAVEDRAFT_22413 [Trametes versicolor FP-101664 SS1]|uniref:uncharacterized protein n=1 Tax=Trametes versicolor (strain FP-101664) TaxID=717944 RepID=UPI0004623AF6|nr:uncharacterized protein TRAVEDRAFT_22413 [Trametes versicolor FP-101664 SS1]EIW56037.1 hypothetical protein TRAVEDRAFT_22413 [Trametes versicolor FP-101664 SS1]